MVANKFLEEVELEDNVRAQTVFMCKHFHQAVRTLSGKSVIHECKVVYRIEQTVCFD